MMHGLTNLKFTKAIRSQETYKLFFVLYFTTPSTAEIIGLSTEYGWNDTDRRKRYSEKHVFPYHSAHHKSYIHWHGIEKGPPQPEAGNYFLCHSMAA
jgi:hypothetical protein